MVHLLVVGAGVDLGVVDDGVDGGEVIAMAVAVEIQELAKCVQVEYTVECHSCGGGGFALSGDSVKAVAKEFYDEGWRWQNDELLCPECLK